MKLFKEIPLGLDPREYDLFSRAMDQFGSGINQILIGLKGSEPKVDFWVEPVCMSEQFLVGLLKVRVMTPTGSFCDQIKIAFWFDREAQITGFQLNGRQITSNEVFNRLVRVLIPV